MKMINKATGEAVYYNPVRKAGKDVHDLGLLWEGE